VSFGVTEDIGTVGDAVTAEIIKNYIETQGNVRTRKLYSNEAI
jgi:hypothetical protein